MCRPEPAAAEQVGLPRLNLAGAAGVCDLDMQLTRRAPLEQQPEGGLAVGSAVLHAVGHEFGDEQGDVGEHGLRHAPAQLAVNQAAGAPGGVGAAGQVSLDRERLHSPQVPVSDSARPKHVS